MNEQIGEEVNKQSRTRATTAQLRLTDHIKSAIRLVKVRMQKYCFVYFLSNSFTDKHS